MLKDLRWKQGRLVAVTIQSTLGGNLRLRSAIPLKAAGLQPARGENPNPFYRLQPVKDPLVAAESPAENGTVGEWMTYDLKTTKGGIYTLTPR